MSKSIEALNRIETMAPFNRANKPNYYSRFMQSSTPFYEDFDLVKKDLEVLEILKNSLELEEEDDYISFKFKFCCDKESLNDDYEMRTIKEWLEDGK